MRVNADSKMLGDPRFKKLGQRLGISHFEAFGRVLPVWMMAYENRSEFMTPSDVDALAELAGFADAMVAANLAETDQSGLRLRGVAERIRFLLVQDRKREMALAAKLSRPHGPAASPPGPSPGTVPRDVPRDVPISPDLDQSLAPDLAPDQKQISLPRAILPSTASVPSTAPNTETVTRRLWKHLEAERARVAAELGLTIRPLPIGDPGERELAHRVVAAGGGERALADGMHVIAVGAAEARVDPERMQWFGGALFSAENWRRCLNSDPANVKARAGPRGANSRPEQPIRTMKTL